MIVVDSSVIIELLLQSLVSNIIEKRLFESGSTLHAPHLLDVEVMQVMRRYAFADELPIEERNLAAIAILRDLPLRRYPHRLLLPRIWSLRHNLSAYDAAYVALAEALDAPLLTRDRRLAAASSHYAAIELI